jgi:RimJ/RimL family protein N-acetyltransferase
MLDALARRPPLELTAVPLDDSAIGTGRPSRPRIGLAPARKDRDMTQPTLSTARLRLLPLADEHLNFEVELDSDPEVMHYIDGRARSRVEAEQAHERRLAAAREVPGLGFWAGFTHGGFIGWWILQPPNGPDQPKRAGEADLGYRLLRRHWRHGYASEGARELIRYGFADLGLNRIFAQTMAVNAASRATMSAVGLTFVRAFISGEPYADLPEAEQGEVEYEITRTTWLGGHAAAGATHPSGETG